MNKSWKRRLILLFALVLSAGGGGLYVAHSVNYRPIVSLLSSLPAHEVGDPIDSLNGVIVYFNGSVANVLNRNVSPDGYNIGLRYQCVEFVKRYYYEFYDHKMPNSYGHAKDFFKKSLNDGAFNKDRSLFQFKNTSDSRPQEGDIIVFDGNIFNPYGHVAIIYYVNDYGISIIQQNPGPTAPSRVELELTNVNGQWTVWENSVLGWLGKR